MARKTVRIRLTAPTILAGEDRFEGDEMEVDEILALNLIMRGRAELAERGRSDKGGRREKS